MWGCRRKTKYDYRWIYLRERSCRIFAIESMGGREGPPNPPDALLCEPHRVELLVQEVARCDRPAPHPGAMRDDPVVLQRVEVVHLLVEQTLLERAQMALPLLGVERSRLLDEQVVQHRVLVAAEVAVRDAHRLELVDVHVRLDDEAALEVHGHLVVATLQHRMVGGGLDDLLPHVEPDLPPLVDEPDPERLVRLRDAAVLEPEPQTRRHARLAEQAAGFGAAGLDVAPVACELLQLRGRRRPRRARHLDAANVLHDRDA